MTVFLDNTIRIDSDMFLELRNSIDTELINILDNVSNGDFESGEINIKIDVSMIQETVEQMDKNSKEVITTEYVRPNIKNSVKSTLKKTRDVKHKIDSKGKELVKYNGRYEMQDFVNPQLDMFK